MDDLERLILLVAARMRVIQARHDLARDVDRSLDRHLLAIDREPEVLRTETRDSDPVLVLDHDLYVDDSDFDELAERCFAARLSYDSRSHAENQQREALRDSLP